MMDNRHLAQIADNGKILFTRVKMPQKDLLDPALTRFLFLEEEC